MTPLSFDTETCLIRPGLLAPPMVCATWQRRGEQAGIEHVRDVEPRIRDWLEDSNTLIVAHFAAYDTVGVCAQFPHLTPLVFNAYRNNRVTCTKIRQQLLDITGGVYRGRPNEKGKWIVHDYSLAALAKRHLGRALEKDEWRLRYHEFLDVPLAQWPEGARRYPLEDARATLGVFESQEKHARFLKDQFRQAYAQFALYLSTAWGLKTNPEGVAELRAELEAAHEELEVELQALGLVRDDGTRNMKAVKGLMVQACADLGLPLRRTEAHGKCKLGDACDKHIALDSDACEAVVEAASLAGHAPDEMPFLDYAEFTTLTKMLSNDVKLLESGNVYPIHPKYDIAETGRTTSSPNIQNLNTGRIKRKESTAQQLRPRVRQAFEPRPGKVFFEADYPQLELYTLAQTCISWLGFSKLAEALNAGLDPHLIIAAKICGIHYEEAVRNKKRPDVDHARQIGKVFNFGKPGGMGNKKLKTWARKTYGVDLSLEQLEEYTLQWHEAFPEMRAHFARVAAMFGDDVERASVQTLFTERYRGGATYCAACNNGFQALGVDCAKAGLCLVAEAEYCDTKSPLYSARTVAFVHDEIIGECDDGPIAHDAAFECARLMVEGANRYLPDVPIPMSKMEPTLMRVWSKEAKQVWDANGRLVPWSLAA